MSNRKQQQEPWCDPLISDRWPPQLEDNIFLVFEALFGHCGGGPQKFNRAL